MAKIPGGITSRPSGKLGNIIFGAARTPEGKVATARERVTPSNPNTAAQQAQRSKFQQAVSVVQSIGPSIYQEDWNRSVGQLPGFQSWQSILLDNIDNSDVLQAPPTRPLGNLHYPDTHSFSTGPTAGEISVSWSTENGDNGTQQDPVILLLIEAEEPASGDRDVVVEDQNYTRLNASDDISVNKNGTDYVACLYLRGQGAADGMLSPAEFSTVTSAA